MRQVVSAYFREMNRNVTVSYEEISVCPLCGRGIQPIFHTASMIRDRQSQRVYLIQECPVCKQGFLSTYIVRSGDLGSGFNAVHQRSDPQAFKPETLDPPIEMVSPEFVTIYQQAVQAEKSGLDQIAGIGYRRALEFLVKDYCKQRHPEKAQAIENAPLSNCIRDYIEYERLKIVASRAAWLGNDQAHYTQKRTDRDLEDLKRLIQLTMHWIIIELGVEEAEKIEWR